MNSLALLQAELNQYVDFQNITNEDIFENKFFFQTFNENYPKNNGIVYIQSGGGIGNAFLAAFIGLYIAYKLKKIPMLTSHTMNCGNLEFSEVFDFNKNIIYGIIYIQKKYVIFYTYQKIYGIMELVTIHFG